MNFIKEYKSMDYTSHSNYTLAKCLILQLVESMGIEGARKYSMDNFQFEEKDSDFLKYLESQDEIVIYRGINNYSSDDSLSWSACVLEAIKFSNMYSDHSGYVLKRTIKASDIIYAYDKEFEILVLPSEEEEEYFGTSDEIRKEYPKVDELLIKITAKL
ncbi:hypothetical protein C4G51_RS18595 [Vibrio parahaemolyticus]|nr:hypothetical protein [Vibrio parahaemolyticus]